MSNPTFIPLSTPQAGQTAATRSALGALVDTRVRGAASRQIVPTRDVEQAIANAARSTDVDFDYLVAQARVESAMNPQAKAPTSSASGLYQFIESTWLDTMKRHGSRFGMSEIAERINVTRSGTAYVANPQQRAAILALRNDPEIASLMAAGLAQDNRAHLTPILGRQPEASELYLAHFLGAGGAGRFLSAMQSDPGQSAAALFRRPAAANKAVFFEPTGKPRSLAGVMGFLSAKIDRAMAQDPLIPSSGEPVDFANRLASYNAQYSGAPNATGRDYGVPYLITAPDVFSPRGPAPVTGGDRMSFPRIEAEPMLSMPAAPVEQTLSVRSRSMSSLLGESLQSSGADQMASPESVERIRRAYERLRAMGL